MPTPKPRNMSRVPRRRLNRITPDDANFQLAHPEIAHQVFVQDKCLDNRGSTRKLVDNFLHSKTPDVVADAEKVIHKLSPSVVVDVYTDTDLSTDDYQLHHEIENVDNLVKLLKSLGTFSPFYLLERWSRDEIYTQIDHILSMEKAGQHIDNWGGMLVRLLKELPRAEARP